MAEAIGVSQD